MGQFSTGFTNIFTVLTARRRHLVCISSKKRVTNSFLLQEALWLGNMPSRCGGEESHPLPQLRLHTVLTSVTAQAAWFRSNQLVSQTMCSHLRCLITQFTQTSSHRSISCQLFQEPFCSCEPASNCAGGRHSPVLPEEVVPCVLLGATTLCDRKRSTAQTLSR